jgi:hypothetical protein
VPARTLVQLRVELQHVKPAIWRRLLVPAPITLARLHQVLQIAMGWTDSHLHEFEIGGTRYGIPDPDWPDSPPVTPENRVTLAQALAPAVKHFTYVYDFGDDWEHKVRVEAILDNELAAPAPICTEGANRCPPEDVGGVSGYLDFLQAINDPAHEEHADMLAWGGRDFDPTAFDIDAVNARLLKLKR